MSLSSFFAQAYDMTYESTSYSSDDGGGLVMLIIAIPLVVVSIMAMWRMFVKAGQPGWAAIIPIYNAYIELKIVARPGWWLILYFIPLVNIAVTIIVALDLAKAFGKSPTFGVLALWLFSFVGYLILGFGKDTYKGAPNHA